MRPLLLAASSLVFLACGDAQKPPAEAPDPLTTGPAPAGASDAPASADVDKGQKLLEAGDKAGAKAAFDAAIAKNPKDPEANYYLGLMAEQAGDAKTAESRYQAALAAKPGLESAATNLSAYYLDQNRFEDAAKVLGPAQQANPRSAPLATNYALALAAKGDQAGAKSAFEKAEKLSPNDPAVLLLEGQWLARWKDPAGAKQKLLAAKKLVGDDAAQLASVGFELKNAGAFPECIETETAAIAKLGSAKGAGELRVIRGLCKLGAKDEAGAIADFKEANKVEPTFAPAYFYLGGRYAEAKKWADAETAYAQYLKLSPEGDLAAKAKERLAAVQEKRGGKKPKK